MPARSGQAGQSRQAPRSRAGAGGDRHRSYSLGDPWSADRDQRPSDRDRPGRSRPQRHHREFPSIAARAHRTRSCLPHRDRHRGGGDPGDAFPCAGARTAGSGGEDPGAARRRLCAGLPVRRRARFVDRRAPRQPARDRLWRRRDVSGLGRAGVGAVDPPHHLPRRGRLRRRDLVRRQDLRRRQPGSRAADPRGRRLGRLDRQGQLSPFHAEGDLRAAGGHRRHLGRTDQPGDPQRALAGAALRVWASSSG